MLRHCERVSDAQISSPSSYQASEGPDDDFLDREVNNDVQEREGSIAPCHSQQLYSISPASLHVSPVQATNASRPKSPVTAYPEDSPTDNPSLLGRDLTSMTDTVSSDLYNIEKMLIESDKLRDPIPSGSISHGFSPAARLQKLHEASVRLQSVAGEPTMQQEATPTLQDFPALGKASKQDNLTHQSHIALHILPRRSYAHVVSEGRSPPLDPHTRSMLLGEVNRDTVSPSNSRKSTRPAPHFAQPTQSFSRRTVHPDNRDKPASTRTQQKGLRRALLPGEWCTSETKRYKTSAVSTPKQLSPGKARAGLEKHTSDSKSFNPEPKIAINQQKAPLTQQKPTQVHIDTREVSADIRTPDDCDSSKSPRGGQSKLLATSLRNSRPDTIKASPDMSLATLPKISNTIITRRISNSEILSPIYQRLETFGLLRPARDTSLYEIDRKRSYPSPAVVRPTAKVLDRMSEPALRSPNNTVDKMSVTSGDTEIIIGRSQKNLQDGEYSRLEASSATEVGRNNCYKQVLKNSTSAKSSTLRATAEEFRMPRVDLPHHTDTQTEHDILRFRTSKEWSSLPLRTKRAIEELRRHSPEHSPISVSPPPARWEDFILPSLPDNQNSYRWSEEDAAHSEGNGRFGPIMLSSVESSTPPSVSPAKDTATSSRPNGLMQGWSIRNANPQQPPNYGWKGGDGLEITFTGWGPQAECYPNSPVSLRVFGSSRSLGMGQLTQSSMVTPLRGESSCKRLDTLQSPNLPSFAKGCGNMRIVEAFESWPGTLETFAECNNCATIH